MKRPPSALATRLERGYRDIGALETAIVFVYSDLRTFGQDMADYPTRDAFFDAILGPLLDNGQTVLVPTFTYTGEGIFEVEKTPSRLGALNKWVITRTGMHRSEHPLFSVAAIGPQADLVTDIGKSAFGAKSIFERLRGRDAAFLHVGRPVAIGNTCVHYVEQAAGATYRYNKAFPTEVWRDGKRIGTDYTAFLRRRDVPGHDFDFVYRFTEEALHAGLGVRETGVNADHTNLSCYCYDRALSFFTDAFYRDPSVFIAEPYAEYR